jgi:hypothetical protein
MLERAYLRQKKQATQNTFNVKLSFSFDFKIHLIKIRQLYRVRPKKRRKTYLRYLCLDLNKTKTGITHFKNTISTTMTNFIHIRFASIWPSQFSKNLFPQSSP